MSLTIASYTTSQPTAAAAPTSTAANGNATRKSGPQEEGTDKVTLGKRPATDGLTYDMPRNAGAENGTRTVQSQGDVQAMLEESNRKAQEIIDLILSMVNRQGTTLREVISGEAALQADPATIAAAKAAIAEDGEWGVRQTAGRILDFARAVIGNDPERLETVRAAVEKGFKEATDILGGTLPEVSQQTYAAVMAEFDRWREQGLDAGTAADQPAG